MTTIRAAVPVGLLLAATLAAAQGTPADAARAAMQAGNYAEAYCLWRGLAERGDADAQYNLGWLYHNGYGLVIDDLAARRWWEKAAAQELPEALYALASLYRSGSKDIPKDGARAIDYLLRAARRGDDESGLLLRTLLARNDAVVRARSVELLTQHGAALGAPLTVVADQAAFRKAPGTEARALAVLARGKALVELARRSGWVQVGDPADGRIGWVKAKQVEPPPQ